MGLPLERERKILRSEIASLSTFLHNVSPRISTYASTREKRRKAQKRLDEVEALILKAKATAV